MPLWLFSKAFWIGLAVVSGLCVVGYVAHSIYVAGAQNVEITQLKEQAKETKKVTKAYAKIDHSLPADSKPAAVEWLRLYTTGTSN